MLENYERDRNGVVRQISVEPIVYDDDYTRSRYASGAPVAEMAALRFGYLVGLLGRAPRSVLDVGYGAGDFLKFAAKRVQHVYGFDAPPAFPIDDSRVQVVNDIYAIEVEVACFFDSLEHFVDPYEIRNLRTSYVYISVPWCHYPHDDWFDVWKHRRPNEHLWHFDLESLTSFMDDCGFEIVAHSDVEDIIRTPSSDLPNILTALFKRRTEPTD